MFTVTSLCAHMIPRCNKIQINLITYKKLIIKYLKNDEREISYLHFGSNMELKKNGYDLTHSCFRFFEWIKHKIFKKILGVFYTFIVFLYT